MKNVTKTNSAQRGYEAAMVDDRGKLETVTKDGSVGERPESGINPSLVWTDLAQDDDEERA